MLSPLDFRVFRSNLHEKKAPIGFVHHDTAADAADASIPQIRYSTKADAMIVNIIFSTVLLTTLDHDFMAVIF